MSRRILKRHFGDENEGLIVVAEKTPFLLGEYYLQVYFVVYDTYGNTSTAVKASLEEEQVKQLMKTLQEILKKWERYKKERGDT